MCKALHFGLEKKRTAFSFYFLEIRLRLFYIIFSFFLTYFTAYYYSIDFFFLVVQPFFGSKNFIFTDITEALSATLNICMLVTLQTTLPLFFYQLWAFTIPGFLKKERKTITLFIFFSFFFFILGGVFLFRFILPEIYNFLCTFEIKKEILTIQLEAKICSYISFTFLFYSYFIFFFQMPLLFFLLINYKIIKASDFSFYRKYIYFFISLLGAFLSPPDLIAQLVFVLTFLFIYELILWLGYILEKVNLPIAESPSILPSIM